MSNLKKTVYKELFASHKIDLNSVQDIERLVDTGWKNHEKAVDLIRQAILFFNIADKSADKAISTAEQIIKTGKDMGFDTSFIEGKLSMGKTLKSKSSKNKDIKYTP
jgi:hypothetical protein